MYELINSKKKILWTIIGVAILITTYLSVGIVKSQFGNQLISGGNNKLIYTITLIIIIVLNLLNFIYIKIFLVVFNINRTNLVIIFYSVILMCLMIIMYPINIHIGIKLIIKIFTFNLLFQKKKIESDILIISLIIGVVDLLMTLLLQWR